MTGNRLSQRGMHRGDRPFHHPRRKRMVATSWLRVLGLHRIFEPDDLLGFLETEGELTRGEPDNLHIYQGLFAIEEDVITLPVGRLVDDELGHAADHNRAADLELRGVTGEGLGVGSRLNLAPGLGAVRCPRGGVAAARPGVVAVGTPAGGAADDEEGVWQVYRQGH